MLSGSGTGYPNGEMHRPGTATVGHGHKFGGTSLVSHPIAKIQQQILFEAGQAFLNSKPSQYEDGSVVLVNTVSVALGDDTYVQETTGHKKLPVVDTGRG